jgi:hypothetical protein
MNKIVEAIGRRHEPRPALPGKRMIARSSVVVAKTVRLNLALVEVIEEMAKREHRSLTAQVECLLEKAVAT